MNEFDSASPLRDDLIHVEFLDCDDDSQLTMIVHKISGNGCLINNGSFHLIDKNQIVAPFPMTPTLFDSIAAIYLRETKRRLHVTDHVVSCRMLFDIHARIREIVREELDK